MPPSNQRAFYRIPFPVWERPRLVIGSQICEVIDCSEQGVRYRPSAALRPVVGAALAGTLRFPSGIAVPVAGTVVRAADAEVAIHLSGEGIPFSIILREQLQLRRRAYQQRTAGSEPLDPC